jgi:choline dehydrogenase-like flavoprotein
VTEHYDVIIVGSGAGGGTLAHTLAQSGKRILLLERGDFLTRETHNWDPGAVFVDGKYISPDTVLDKNFYLSMDIPVAGVAHQAGTCRFGTDPAASVLDANCKAHELDNLYVVDTSFFPSIGAVNPALTAMANAIRVGEHLLSRMS